MKLILLPIILFFASIAHSQDTITVHFKEWYGGFSYSSGNDFTLYFSNQKTLVNIDSIDLFVRDLKMSFPGNLLMDYTSVCSSSFGWTQYGHYISDTISTRYYGIQANQITTSGDEITRAVFYYSDGTKKEPFVIYTEGYLAYP